MCYESRYLTFHQQSSVQEEDDELFRTLCFLCVLRITTHTTIHIDTRCLWFHKSSCNIVEMLQVGASTLLIDEDTCATNFMIRDRRMEALIRKDKEPITPYLWRVRSLFEHLGVSSIMVIGGLGSYFDVADTVIAMDSYLAHDLTLQAKSISKQFARKNHPRSSRL